jgi:cell division GTPase FtsZ
MKLIGIGAAGNKAVKFVVDSLGEKHAPDYLLINTTTKDFPENSDGHCALISNTGGCGKERAISEELTERFLSNKDCVERLNKFLVGENGNETHVVLVTSMGGGTGSGATNLLADWIYEKVGMDVTIIAFKGLGEDLRERQNTIDFMKEVSPNVTLQIIDNSKFMKEASGNKVEAERLANSQLLTSVIFMLPFKFRKAAQNIDDTDRYKVVTMSGYQFIEYGELEDIRNKEDMEEAIKKVVDNSYSLPTTPSCGCMGIVFTIDESTEKWIDYNWTYLKERYGAATEIYPHIQRRREENPEKREWVAFIISGLKLPIGELEKMYDEYQDYARETDTAPDRFHEMANQMDTSVIESSRFNRGANRRRRIMGADTTQSSETDDFFAKRKAQQKDGISNGTFTTGDGQSQF